MEWLIAYSWWHIDLYDSQGIKFGEHFVAKYKQCATFEMAVADTMKYIRQQQFPRRGKLFDSGSIKCEFWDVSHFAKKRGLLRGHAHIDDIIRVDIGFQGGDGSEFHLLTPVALAYAVNTILAKDNQPLPGATLSTWQHDTLVETLHAIKNNQRRTIVWELCPRFGKTIAAGALATELNVDMLVVVSYMLTSFTSFMKDLSGFQQFTNRVHIDLRDDDYLQQIEDARSDGKQMVVYLSLCPGEKRQDRVEYIFSLQLSRLVVIDEADYGAYRPQQAKLLQKARQGQDIVVLMTGTNADRAVGDWRPDYYTSTTYPELLMEKKVPSTNVCSSLSTFNIDLNRSSMIVDIEFYQMDLHRLVDHCIQNGLLDDRELASWSKFAEAPPKAKSLFIGMLEALFLGKHGLHELNTDLQFRLFGARSVTQRVAIMWLPQNIRSEWLIEIEKYAREALPGFVVKAIHGENDDSTTNEKAEQFAKDTIKEAQGKSVLFLAAKMAQRSFSVPEISEVYLAYDRGQDGSTSQRISRGLTSGLCGKIAKIVSLSFDPNRDDKFDAVMLKAAINYQRKHNIRDLYTTLHTTLNTIDMFSCLPSGSVKMHRDEYMKQLIENDRLERLIGSNIDATSWSQEILEYLASVKTSYSRNVRTTIAPTGKISEKIKNKSQLRGSELQEHNRLMKSAMETILAVVENIDVLLLGLKELKGDKVPTVDEIIEAVSSNADDQKKVEARFDNIPFDAIRFLFTSGTLNKELLQLHLNHVMKV